MEANLNKEPILKVNDLVVNFNAYAGTVQAVRGVSFELYEGEKLSPPPPATCTIGREMPRSRRQQNYRSRHQNGERKRHGRQVVPSAHHGKHLHRATSVRHNIPILFYFIL